MPDRLSRYVLLNRLGTGGMGTVYRARDDLNGTDVALKVLHPYLANDAEYVRRFEREARIAQSIDVPEVVKVLGSGREDETYFLVMELVPGETLADVMQKRRRMPVEQVVGIAKSVARAMAAAHARGIVHRDISPQNVMITPDGEAKVMDFGVSRDLSQVTMTATSMLMGKPHYIAPELVTSASRPDIRSDIYALGVMLFQMLAGNVPFTAPTPYAVMQKHVSEAPPEVDTLRPDTPLWLVEVVARCLAKEPSGRYQTPVDLLQGLEGAETTRVQTPAASWSPPAEETVAVRQTGGHLETMTPTTPGPRSVHPMTPAPGVGSKAGATSSGGMSKTPLLIGGGLLALAVVFAFLTLSGGGDSKQSGSGDTKQAGGGDSSPVPALLKATWVSPAEGQLLTTGAFTFQAKLEPESLASTVSSLDLKVFWSNTWVTACFAAPKSSGMFECSADVSAAEGPVSLSYDVVFKDGTVKHAVAGQRNVSRPVSQARVDPLPTQVVPLPSLDRFDCNAIRGTPYRSDAERGWFLANCPSTTVPPTSIPATPTPAPPAVTPPAPGTYQINRVLGTDSGVTLTLTTIVYEASGRMTVNFLQRNTGSVYASARLACLSSSPPETGSQPGASITGVDGYCKQHPGEQFTLTTGQSKAQFSIFQTSGLDVSKPITLNVSGHTASNIFLR